MHSFLISDGNPSLTFIISRLSIFVPVRGSGKSAEVVGESDYYQLGEKGTTITVRIGWMGLGNKGAFVHA